VECQKIAWYTKRCFEERDLQTYGHLSSKYSAKIEGIVFVLCGGDSFVGVD